jgi:hypothetical protein
MIRNFMLMLGVLCGFAVTQVNAIVPDGFYWEKNDFIHTSSENLYFTYKFKASERPVLGQGVKFKIYDKKGKQVIKGTSLDYKIINNLAVFKLVSAIKTSKWPTGWYKLEITPAKKAQWFSLRFYHQNTLGYKQVLYLLDNVTPEGYAAWLNNDSEYKIEALRSFLANKPPELVVISHWKTMDKGVIKQLTEYVKNGGIIVIFGANTPGLECLSPLKLEQRTPFNYKPENLMKFKSGCKIDTSPWQGLAAYHVNATLSPGSTGWVYGKNEQPFFAEKSYGKGKVYAVASALKPGIIYNTIIGDLLGLKSPAPEKAEAIKQGEYGRGISNANIGRFGWLNNDRINAIGIQPDFSWRMWDVKQDTFRVEFPRLSGKPKVNIFCKEANWLSKHLICSGGIFGKQTNIYLGLGTPGVLFRNKNAASVTIQTPNCNNLAYSSAAGAETIKLKPGKIIKPVKMNRNWLLIWAGDYYGLNWPLLICVNRKILHIRQLSRNSIKITFARPGLDIAVMPLSGIHHFTEDQVETWNNKLPRKVIDQANMWSRLQACRIINCREDFKVDRKTKTVKVRNTYEYLELRNDWQTKPLKMAPVPPLLPLCVPAGMVSLSPQTKDTGYRTFHGPLFAQLNSQTTSYNLKLPDLNYPLAASKSKIKTENPLAQKLLKRICDHIARPGLIYLPVKYHYVGKKKGKVYPVRDLKPACFYRATENILDKNFIDLHRSMGGSFGLIMFKPYLDSTTGNEKTKKTVNTKIQRNIIRDIEFFQYKTFMRYRVEPNGGEKYLNSFLYPVRLNDGYRIFHDINETAGIVLYSIYLYSKILNDTNFLKSNISYINATEKYLTTFNDWSWMSATAVEWGMGNNIDMLNGEFPAWVALYHIRKRLGDQPGSDFATYMAARTSISQVARFFFGKYYNSIKFPDLLKLVPEIHEQAGLNQQVNAKAGYLPYGLASGYGEGWPSLWPNNISKSYLRRYFTGIDIYNNSKGVAIEAIKLYNNPQIMEVLNKYEIAFRNASFSQNIPFCYTRIACYGWLTENRDQLITDLNRILSQKANSVSALGSGTANWEVSSMTILLELLNKLDMLSKLDKTNNK